MMGKSQRAPGKDPTMKHLSLPILLLTLAAMLLPVLTLAADPVASPAPLALAIFLKESIFPILAAFLLGVVTLVLNYVGQKYKVEALTQKNNLLEQIAYQGITLAEEWAAKQVADRATITGSDKLDVAVNHVLTLMPKVSEAQAEDIVHSLLARIPGLGATQTAAYPLATPVAAPTVP
jgi:hypothetical protein